MIWTSTSSASSAQAVSMAFARTSPSSAQLSASCLSDHLTPIQRQDAIFSFLTATSAPEMLGDLVPERIGCRGEDTIGGLSNSLEDLWNQVMAAFPIEPEIVQDEQDVGRCLLRDHTDWNRRPAILPRVAIWSSPHRSCQFCLGARSAFRASVLAA